MNVIKADLTRTCEGCRFVVMENWSKKHKPFFRCMAPGWGYGRTIGIGRLDPWVPAWCPEMENKEEKTTCQK